MPKRQRISRADFSSIQSLRSRRFFGVYFSLSVSALPPSPSSTESVTKYSCVVSKKVAPHAADRNRVKRRCREVCRLSTIGFSTLRACIFYAKKESKGASFSEIKSDVNQLLLQATRLPDTAFAGYNTRQ